MPRGRTLKIARGHTPCQAQATVIPQPLWLAGPGARWVALPGGPAKIGGPRIGGAREARKVGAHLAGALRAAGAGYLNFVVAPVSWRPVVGVALTRRSPFGRCLTGAGRSVGWSSPTRPARSTWSTAGGRRSGMPLPASWRRPAGEWSGKMLLLMQAHQRDGLGRSVSGLAVWAASVAGPRPPSPPGIPHHRRFLALDSHDRETASLD